MGKRKFSIMCVITAELILDDEVIQVVDDEWRKELYNLKTPEEIAKHIAYNLLTGRTLSMIDGWQDLPSGKKSSALDELAVLSNDSWRINAGETKSDEKDYEAEKL